MNQRTFKLLAKLVFHRWFRLTRGMTLGARAVVFNDAGHVLLVRHSYAPGWLFPGGGVERGETIIETVIHELIEEAGIAITTDDADLYGFYSNEKHFRGDHIALFIIKNYQQEPWKPTREILQAKFFPPDALPEGTTNGTRERLAEILHGAAKSQHW